MASLSERLTRAQHMRLSRRRARNTTNSELRLEAIEQWGNIPITERPPLFMHFLSGRVDYDDFQMSSYEWDCQKCRERRQEAGRNAQQEAWKDEYLKRPMINARSLPSIKQEIGAQKKRNFGLDEDECLLIYDGKLSCREQKRRSELLEKRAASQKANATRSDPVVIHDGSEPYDRSLEPTQLPTPPSSSPREAYQARRPSSGLEVEVCCSNGRRAPCINEGKAESRISIVDLQSDDENGHILIHGIAASRHLDGESGNGDSDAGLPDMSLYDIESYTTQWRIQQIRELVPDRSIRDCHAALLKNGGDWLAAKKLLTQRDSNRGWRNSFAELPESSKIEDEKPGRTDHESANDVAAKPQSDDGEPKDATVGIVIADQEEVKPSPLALADAGASVSISPATSRQEQQDSDNAARLTNSNTETPSEMPNEVSIILPATSRYPVSLRDTHIYTHDLDAKTRPIMTRKRSQVAQPQHGALPHFPNPNPNHFSSIAKLEPSKATFSSALKNKPSKPHDSPFTSANPALPIGSAITLPHPKSMFLAGRRTLLFEYNQDVAYYDLNLDEDGVFDAEAFAEQHFQDGESDSDDESPLALEGGKGMDAGSVPMFAVGVVETHASP